MLKELILVPRTIYSVFFVLLGIITAFGTKNFYATPSVGSFLFVFLFSFVWQYYVLHYVLKTMNIRQRLITLLVWLTVSFVIGSWGLNELETFNWLQDRSTIMEEFALWMSIYLSGASMFVAGACARRAFEKHKAL